MCLCLVRPAQNCRWVHGFDCIQGPDFNFGIQGANSDIVSETTVGCVVLRLIRSRRYWGIVKPFQAEGETGQNEVVMSVEVFFGLVVDIDFELGYFILGFGNNEEVVGWEDFELFSLIILGILMKP